MFDHTTFKPHTMWLFPLAIASVLSLNFCLLTGLVPAWGRWYSPSPAYRLQTDAITDGRIAISDSPSDAMHDYAWADGSVQQVWGLGVPLFRLPFEIMARAFGFPAFPDRLVLAAALVLFYALGINVMLRPAESPGVRPWCTALTNHPFRVAAFIAIALFPTVTTLCMGPFNVYEEAVFYGYLAAAGLFIGMQSFIRSPCLSIYLTICTLSGLIPLVRATAGSYGFATVCVSAVVARYALGWKSAVIGIGLFAGGGAVVFGSNAIRFGHGTEFGHQLNVSGGDLTYMSRMGSPFDEEPVFSAAMELAGSVFGSPRWNGFDCYAADIVIFQSPTIRWRHFYGHTFDVSHLLIILLIGAWVAGSWRRCEGHRFFFMTPLGSAFLWFIISASILSVFYLRFHAISSRYVLDFAPAIAGLICGGLLQIDGAFQPSNGRARSMRSLLLFGAIWYFGEIYLGSHEAEPTEVLTHAEAMQAMPHLHVATEYSPIHHDTSVYFPANQRLSRGWRDNGTTEPLVQLFASNLTTLAIDVEPIDDGTAFDEECRHIRTKLGLEFLRLDKTVRIERGRRIFYSLPPDSRYSRGTHLLFIAMASRDEVLRSDSRFLLKRIELNPEDSNLN